MVGLLVIFLCTYFTSVAYSVPYTVPITPRTTDIASNSAQNDSQAINAVVMDHSGKDITSAFDVMVFYDSSTPSNSTGRANDTKVPGNGTNDLLDRRMPLFYRQITHCSTPTSTFVSSVCHPTDNRPGSLQAYTVICHRTQDVFHPYTAKFLYSTTVPVQRSGHCWPNELCLNNGNPNDHGVKYAYCVQRGAFSKLGSTSPIGLKLNKQSLMRELQGKSLSMVVSKPDLSTPLEVDKFGVEAEVGGTSSSEVSGAIGSCRDCMELETQQFKEGTESLKASATLLTTGAVAGVLWLAIMSG